MKKLLDVLNELEELKPDVQRRTEELNMKSRNQVNNWGQVHQNSLVGNSLEWSPVNRQTVKNKSRQEQDVERSLMMVERKSQLTFFCRSLSFPRPKEETLSRHSI